MSDSKIACVQCNITFSTKWNLLRHKRKFHPEDVVIKCTQICGVCQNKFRTIFDLHSHIQKEHTDVKLEFVEKVFYCQSDFEKWKTDIERENASSYTLRIKEENEDATVLHYRCNRSGPPILKEKKKDKDV